MAAVLSRTAPLRRASRLFSSYATSSRLTLHLSKEIPKSHLHRPLPQSDVGSFTKLPRFLSTNANAAGAAANAQADSALKGTASDAHSDQGKQSGDSHHSSEQGKSIRGGPISWLSFLLLVASGAGVVFYYDQEKKRHIEDINTSSTAVKQGPSVGKAAIGGPFNLLDHDGISVTEKDFKGKWTLIYFGFTHCPDICPDELQKLAAAIDKIKGKAGFEIVPVFISVDPERDTVEQVREYVKEFHPKLIGLTGHPDEIKKAARAYRVYYMKTEEEGSDGSDYLVDHSIIMYLMDPNMEFVKFFGKNNDVDALSEGIINEIKQYKKAKA
ncbi:protein SCO1 homolog 1, mitochondrial [Cynara cardunculus var. scolymus]|uniref:protein SCO1 homolog 1, mitochondrial n=1 Tax=Cynara cardunculus var. scolymus TaxID=59895 RepID=UPI000D62AA1B|nr:protein SCO1 homolog 1, mitochondrial [Cynara cardunculus var. scolymus]